MSITVRLWSKEELEEVRYNKWLATLLMNHQTYSKEEINALYTIPSKNQKTYICQWDNDEGIIIKATDEKMLARFIDTDYTRRPDEVYQVITQYRPVKL